MLTLFPTPKSFRRGNMLTLFPSLENFRRGIDRLLRDYIDHALSGYCNRAHSNTPPVGLFSSALVIRGISVAICEVKSANSCW